MTRDGKSRKESGRAESEKVANDCLSFFRLMTSSIVRLTPSTTTVAPSFIFLSSSSDKTRFALESSSRSSPVWYRWSMYSRGVRPRWLSMWWKAVGARQRVRDKIKKRGNEIISKQRLTVLRDVSDNQIGVLPDFSTLVGLGFSDQKFDESRFSRSVGSKNRDSRRKRDLQRDVVHYIAPN